RTRLLQSSPDRAAFVVEPAAAEDAALVQFLRNFKPQPEIFTRYQPTEFVDQLHSRWLERSGGGADAAADFTTPLSIFISYASQDAAAAARIAGLIGEARLPVWRDRSRLGSGDDWARKIARNIDVAAAFVPILSMSTLVGVRRGIRRRWGHTLTVNGGRTQSERTVYALDLE